MRPTTFFLFSILLMPTLGAQEPEESRNLDDPVGSLVGKTVSRNEFIHFLARKFHCLPLGKNILNDLRDRILVETVSRKLKITVISEEIEREFKALDDRVVRETGGKHDLTSVLARKKITTKEFKSSLARLIALKKIIRLEKKLADATSVSDEDAAKWLRDRAAAVKILSDPDALPSGTALQVGDEEVSMTRFGTLLFENLSLLDRARELDRLLKECLIQRLLDDHDITIQEADLDAAIEQDRLQYAQNPQTKGVAYEAILKQLGTSIESKKRNPGFRANVSILKLAQSLFKDADLKKFYQSNQDRLGPSVRVRHILIRTKETRQKFAAGTDDDTALKKIQTLRNKITGGDKFEKIARLASDDRSKFNGGDIGFIFKKGRMDPCFSRAAFGLKVGEVSQPVRTRYGYHLIQVTEKKPAAPFAKARYRILRSRARAWFEEKVAWAKMKNSFLDMLRAEKK